MSTSSLDAPDISYQVDEAALRDPEGFLERATDIPSAASRHRIPLEAAGIMDQQISLRLLDLAGPPDGLRLNGTVSATAMLDGDHRGVHMSRIVEAVSAAEGQVWSSLSAAVEELAADVARRQSAARAAVSVQGTVRFPRQTRVTGRTSPDSLGLHAAGVFAREEATSRVGLTATIMTACPCTRAYSWYSAIMAVAEVAGLETANLVAGRLETFTHSQRAFVTVTADAGPGGISLSDAYGAVTAATHLVQELLKRPDEHDLVRRAHARPQFTEDVVRDVAAELASRVSGSAAPSARVTIESSALESIHAHAVHSRLDLTLEEISECLNS